MRLCLLAALVGPLTAPAVPAQTETLTIDEAVRLSLGRAPGVAGALAAAARAEAGLRDARARRWPRLSLDGALQRFEEPMIVAPLHSIELSQPPVFDQTLLQSSLLLSYTLLDGGQRRGRIGQAAALNSAAEAGADGATQSVIATTVQAFSDVLVARDGLDAQLRRLGALLAEAERVARFLAEGRAARVESLRAEAALARARADSSHAAAQLQVAESGLARLLGVEVAAVRSRSLAALRPTRAPPPTDAELVTAAHAGNAAVAAAHRRLEAATAELRVARGEWIPTLRLEGRTITYGSGEGSYSTEWQAGVRLSYPLFTGGSRGAGVARARAGVAQAEAELREARDALGGGLDLAQSRLADSRSRVAALETALVHLTEVARTELLLLEQGAGTQAEYLRSEADLAGARAELAAARGAEIVAVVELERLTGRLLPGRLALIVESER